MKENWYLANVDTSVNKEYSIHIHGKITDEERHQVLACFKFADIYSRITLFKEMAIQNGDDLIGYLKSSNIENLNHKKVSDFQILVNANKIITNFVASIRMYIDTLERLITKLGSKDDLIDFKELTAKLYDEHVEYRFFSNLRNYIIHYSLPFTTLNANTINGFSILCPKGHLLEFDNWKQVKSDIENMEDNIDISSLTFVMQACIYTLYINFFSYFVKQIHEHIQCFEDFCKKNKVKNPAFCTMITENGTLKLNKINPLPIKDLYEMIDILGHNPHIKINYFK